MLNMQAFHKLLSTSSQNKDSYITALLAITKVRPDQLSVLANGLEWDPWASANTDPVKA